MNSDTSTTSNNNVQQFIAAGAALLATTFSGLMVSHAQEKLYELGPQKLDNIGPQNFAKTILPIREATLQELTKWINEIQNGQSERDKAARLIKVQPGVGNCMVVHTDETRTQVVMGSPLVDEENVRHVARATPPLTLLGHVDYICNRPNHPVAWQLHNWNVGSPLDSVPK